MSTTVAVLRMEPFGLVANKGETERLMDFASHRAFTCAAWSGNAGREQGTSIYTLDAHLRATERWSGRPARIALPFGYSPTMLLVLGPLCLLPERAAFVAWSLGGLLATMVVVLRAGVDWLALLALVTPLTISSIALGQTAILSTAALLFLMADDRDADPSTVSWTDGAVLCLLTAKPPLAVTAAVALLARGRWRTVALGGALTVASTIALLPWLGPGWAGDYLRLVQNYDRVRLPAAFAWSIVPDLMSNLRATLHSDLGFRDDVAIRVSGAVWAASLGAIFLAARRVSLGWARVWNLTILAYLLFCPHVSATEDLALVCVLATADSSGRDKAVAIGAVVIVLAGLLLSPAIGPLHDRRPSMLFFAKLALAAVCLSRRGFYHDHESPARALGLGGIAPSHQGT